MKILTKKRYEDLIAEEYDKLTSGGRSTKGYTILPVYIDKKIKIKGLEQKWQEYARKEGNKQTKCDICGREVKGKYLNKHYWKKHFIWILGRRVGVW
jgi:hypothetical protein